MQMTRAMPRAKRRLYMRGTPATWITRVMYEYPRMSAVHRRDARLVNMMERPKKIKRELDSRMVTDFEVLMMGKKMNKHTINPMRADTAITRVMEKRGLTPYNV